MSSSVSSLVAHALFTQGLQAGGSSLVPLSALVTRLAWASYFPRHRVLLMSSEVPDSSSTQSNSFPPLPV